MKRSKLGRLISLINALEIIGFLSYFGFCTVYCLLESGQFGLPSDLKFLFALLSWCAVGVIPFVLGELMSFGIGISRRMESKKFFHLRPLLYDVASSLAVVAPVFAYSNIGWIKAHIGYVYPFLHVLFFVFVSACWIDKKSSREELEELYRCIK